LVKNLSGLKPLGRAVLVQPYESLPELRSKLIEIPQSARERIAMAEQEAIVVAVGPEAWRDEGQPRAKPGDRVMISKYAGTIVVGVLDKKQYRCVNANDIFLSIDAAEAAVDEMVDKAA
jgi:co-chaperonin GroES (HSP10)